jgi:hypothetical protein
VILVVEALAKVLCPCTEKVPVLVVEASTLLLLVKLVTVLFNTVALVRVADPEAIVALAIVVVAKVVTPCTEKVPVLVVEATERLVILA